MNVYEKLMTVQSKLKAPKNQWNKFSSYYYRSCEDILEGLKPLLTEVKAIVILKDEVKNIGERFYIEATAIFVDVEKSEKIEVSALAREDDSKKGMDLAQVTGSVSSYARKYALNGLFCIDDSKDSDTGENSDKGNKDKPKEKTAAEKAADKLIALAKLKGVTEGSLKKKYSREIVYMSKEQKEEATMELNAMPDKKRDSF